MTHWIRFRTLIVSGLCILLITSFVARTHARAKAELGAGAAPTLDQPVIAKMAEIAGDIVGECQIREMFRFECGDPAGEMIVGCGHGVRRGKPRLTQILHAGLGNHLDRFHAEIVHVGTIPFDLGFHLGIV